MSLQDRENCGDVVHLTGNPLHYLEESLGGIGVGVVGMVPLGGEVLVASFALPALRCSDSMSVRVRWKDWVDRR